MSVLMRMPRDSRSREPGNVNMTSGIIPYVFQDTDSYNIRMYNIDGKRIMSNPTGRKIYIENGRKIIR